MPRKKSSPPASYHSAARWSASHDFICLDSSEPAGSGRPARELLRGPSKAARLLFPGLNLLSGGAQELNDRIQIDKLLGCQAAMRHLPCPSLRRAGLVLPANGRSGMPKAFKGFESSQLVALLFPLFLFFYTL